MRLNERKGSDCIKHFGDITQLNGHELPIVDCIIGGSPCQDLSVAGKRAGLAGERSGLFMEQMRIVKEMRERDVRDNGRTGFAVRPRFMVWENVPGAFSSGKPKGADFAAVIEEIIKVAEPDACVQVCVPDGGWSKSGCYYSADGRWSIAWRLHDAQFWGVPQRRKRIALVADFSGLSAPEILFERKGMSGDIESGEQTREETTGDVGKGIETASGVIPINTMVATRDTPEARTTFGVGAPGDPQFTLSAAHEHAVFAAGFSFGQSAKARSIGYQEEMSPTLRGGEGGNQKPRVMAFAQNQVGEVRVSPMSGTLNTNSNASGRNSPLVYDARGNGDGKIAPTMAGDHQNRVTDYTALCIGNGQTNNISMKPIANTLDTLDDVQKVLISKNAMHDHQAVMVLNDQGGSVMDVSHENTATLRAQSHGYEPAVMNQFFVRRLTPLECERLQGMPDDWSRYGINEKGEVYELPDSARYRLQGNGIATPFWKYLLKRISAQYERDPTMGSLFDGQASFPMLWEGINGSGTCLWSSEIDKHAVAVAKYHFPEDGANPQER